MGKSYALSTGPGCTSFALCPGRRAGATRSPPGPVCRSYALCTGPGRKSFALCPDWRCRRHPPRQLAREPCAAHASTPPVACPVKVEDTDDAVHDKIYETFYYHFLYTFFLFDYIFSQVYNELDDQRRRRRRRRAPTETLTWRR